MEVSPETRYEMEVSRSAIWKQDGTQDPEELIAHPSGYQHG